MGIYENQTMNNKTYYTYHCFGCQAHGNIPHDEVNSWLGTIAVGGKTVLGLKSGKVTRKSKPSFSTWYNTTVPLSNTPGFLSQQFWNDCWNFFADRNINPDIVFENNIRVDEQQQALLFIQTYNDIVVSAQARWLDSKRKPKILHLDMDMDSAHIPVLNGSRCCEIKSPFKRGEHAVVFIAESYCDGLALQSKFPHNPVFTALSTGISLAQVGALHLMLTNVSARDILICFDTDAAGVKGGTELMKELKKLGHKHVSLILPATEHDPIMKPYHTEYLDILEEYFDTDTNKD